MKPEKSQASPAQQRGGGLPPAEERRTQIALFRYALIAPLLNRPLERGEIGSHLKALPSQTHRIPYSSRSTLDEWTIWRYLAKYRQGGFEALKPQPRADAGKSRRIPDEIIEKAIALRQELPTRSANTIVQILKRDPAYPAHLTLATRTLRAILQARGATREKLTGQSNKAFRRFERSTSPPNWLQSAPHSASARSTPLPTPLTPVARSSASSARSARSSWPKWSRRRRPPSRTSTPRFRPGSSSSTTRPSTPRLGKPLWIASSRPWPTSPFARPIPGSCVRPSCGERSAPSLAQPPYLCKAKALRREAKGASDRAQGHDSNKGEWLSFITE
jgi:hypothetical protein